MTLPRALLLTLFLLILVPITHAQDIPPCDQRSGFLRQPWFNGNLWCLELVVKDIDAGELAYTALAVGDDGTLYAARPLAGQILALTDTDADGLPDSAQVFAEDLRLPNSLFYYDNALYISGGQYIYRVSAGEVEILVDDLPFGRGFWTGGLTIHDERIYVGIAAPCDDCAETEPERGAILSFALDGTDRQIVASGLRNPVGLAALHGDLWVTDSLPRSLYSLPDADELNRIRHGADFGWPSCIGAENTPHHPGRDCAESITPTLTFPTGSAPAALTPYQGESFPWLQGALLVTLRGTKNYPTLTGAALAVVYFNDAGRPVSSDIILPQQGDPRNPPDVRWQAIQVQGSGFWPQRPLDVAISPEGWIYVSVTGGRILALRPRS